MISVIVPVYNVEKYLCKCVESILNQTCTDLEVILVDDGSPDNCPQICDELARTDKRIKVIHQANGGLSCARNAGLDAASGEYVTFVDSDDTINPQMYESMLRIMSSTGADICMGGCQIVNDDMTILSSDAHTEGQVFQSEELMRKIVLPLKTSVCDKIFLRSSINDIRFPNGKIHNEDLVFFVELLTPDTKLATTSYIGYNYYKRGNSITTSSFNEGSFEEIWCKDKAAEIMKNRFPSYETESVLWSFRARMNVLRTMYKAKAQDKYASNVLAYEQYIHRNYYSLKSFLKFKERIEYILYCHFKWLYKKLTK